MASTARAMPVSRAIAGQALKDGEAKALGDAGEERVQVFDESHVFTSSVDVAEDDQVAAWAKDVLSDYAPPDLLLNNAGVINRNAPLWEISAGEFERVIDINVNGVFYCTREAIPQMKEAGRGSIINLSSIYGIVGAPDAPPYHASKGAVRLNNMCGGRDGLASSRGGRGQWRASPGPAGIESPDHEEMFMLESRIVGIDLIEVEPIPGAELMVGDFLSDEAPDRLKTALGGPADRRGGTPAGW